MRYFDSTFFKFLIGLLLIIVLGLIFISEVNAAQVDINTASSEELQTLSGIGEIKAQAIIDYRNGPSGPFEAIEEIQEVSGIGDATYAAIKDFITVGDIGEEQEPQESEQDSSSRNSSEVIEHAELGVTASGERLGVAGVPMYFSARASGRSLRRGEYQWSFGDGGTAVGGEVGHAYLYPGEYAVVVRAGRRGEESVSRLNIKVVPDTLKITVADSSRVEVWNDGKIDLDLYGRAVVVEDKSFIFPQDMIIRAGQKISIPSSISGLGGASARIVLVGQETVVTGPSEEDKKRIAEIESEILTLQIKQMELKRSESDMQQMATPMAALENATSSDGAGYIDEESGWLSVIKRFFLSR